MHQLNSFSEILKSLRMERKIGQVELAKIINVSKGAISLWENGKREPTLSSLVALAKYFNVSLDYLVGLEE